MAIHMCQFASMAEAFASCDNDAPISLHSHLAHITFGSANGPT